MNQSLKAILCCGVLALFFVGCEKSSESEIRRAKLVGSENIQLKKQLELKEKEIQEQKDLLAKYQSDTVKAIDEAGDANLKVLQMLAETSKKNEALHEENLRLKAQLEELKAAGSTK